MTRIVTDWGPARRCVIPFWSRKSYVSETPRGLRARLRQRNFRTRRSTHRSPGQTLPDVTSAPSSRSPQRLIDLLLATRWLLRPRISLDHTGWSALFGRGSSRREASSPFVDLDISRGPSREIRITAYPVSTNLTPERLRLLDRYLCLSG